MSDAPVFTDLRRTFEWTCPECGSDHYDVGEVDGQILTCEGCSKAVLVRWPGLSAEGVVAEEPEWEYGYELIESDTRDVLTRSGAFESFEAAQHWAQKAHKDESDPEYPPLDVLIVRRRKAGPWVPVEQGADG
ncbi:hypothetical protein [Microbacterium sp. H6]|uniref:hypothetical protein n=1 Tax=Microbacterium sp. H6 TaxID=421122 RepID=UPI000DE436B4|nr:hypothetical protein [Microbacterium sp. H6]RBO73508.1 hypothetical protein DSP71_04955 [Microbacterium sp. H6]